MMQTVTSNSLSELPNELLHHIVSFLPANTLLKLASACRVLNEIALVHFFTGYSPTESAALVIHIPPLAFAGARDGRMVLGAFRIAISLRHINVLKCYITQWEKELIPNGLFYWHVLDELYDLVERLDYIGRVELHIRNAAHKLGPNNNVDVRQLMGPKEWGKSYGRLVKILMMKSTNIKLTHDIMPFHTHREVPTSPFPLVSIIQYLWNRFWAQSPPLTPFKIYSPSYELEWTDEQKHSFTKDDIRTISPTIIEGLRVQSLTLSEGLMLYPPIVNWLPLFFRHSHLTSLTLYTIILPLHLWNPIILSISPTLTQLQHFRTHRCNIRASSLVWLLDDLRNLQSLEIGQYAEEPHGGRTLPFFSSSSFPFLTHLAAESRWLLYLLGIKESDVESYLNSPDDQQPPEVKHLPSLSTLILLHNRDELYRSNIPRSLHTPSTIRLLHSILHPRRPSGTFKHFGFRSFKYECGRIGLEPIADQVFPDTAINYNRLDLPEYSLLDVVRLEDFRGLASGLLEEKEQLKQWLTGLRSLKIVELCIQKLYGDCYSNKYEAKDAQLATVVGQIFLALHVCAIEVIVIDDPI